MLFDALIPNEFVERQVAEPVADLASIGGELESLPEFEEMLVLLTALEIVDGAVTGSSVAVAGDDDLVAVVLGKELLLASDGDVGAVPAGLLQVSGPARFRPKQGVVDLIGGGEGNGLEELVNFSGRRPRRAASRRGALRRRSRRGWCHPGARQ